MAPQFTDKVGVLNGAGKETATLGGGETGDLYLRNKDGSFTIALRAVENNVAGMWIGGQGQTGFATLRSGAGKDTATLGGETGDLYLRNKDGNFTIALRAVENNVAGMWIGGQGQTGFATLRSGAGKDTATLGGETGDLYLRNKDGNFTIALRAV
ncbi:hypothetical protein ACFQX4_26135, partial [Roseomonas sp. GCM10028921]